MSGGSILLAEDDENDVFLMKYAFRQADIPNPVLVVSDGQQVVEYLSGVGNYANRDRYPFPSLLLLDLKLPLKSGLEVLQWIQGNPACAGLVRIVLTASAHPQDVLRAYELGANSFIVKPSDIHQRAAIASHLKGWWLELNTFPTPA
jgi:CheY-like chemotaxis protein